METLATVTTALDALFRPDELGTDPSFSRHLPRVYNDSNVDWRSAFEPAFVERFNGLMLRGAETVHAVYTSVFPREEVLETFIARAGKGDLFFTHHPLDMECGDPRGAWGRGFLPIPSHLIDQMQSRRLSFYACHVPLDYNPTISTNLAMAESLSARPVEPFASIGDKHVALICETSPISTDALIDRIRHEYAIPYVDFEGVKHEHITRIAVVAGAGDKVEWMQEAAARGVQAYVTGEVHCHIDNDYGRQRYRQMMDYVQTTPLSLIGVSHAASEQYVLKTSMARWFQEQFDLQVEVLPLQKWWQ